jgi:hypothetical protein
MCLQGSSHATPNFPMPPFGVMVSKQWLFAKGGRPVIYQPSGELDLLPESLRWRHKDFNEPGNPKNDYTWEREWRIEIDALKLEPKECTLIVPDRDWDYRLRDEHIHSDMQTASFFISTFKTPFARVTGYDWHVLALGDLAAFDERLMGALKSRSA